MKIKIVFALVGICCTLPLLSSQQDKETIVLELKVVCVAPNQTASNQTIDPITVLKLDALDNQLTAETVELVNPKAPFKLSGSDNNCYLVRKVDKKSAAANPVGQDQINRALREMFASINPAASSLGIDMETLLQQK